MPINPDATQSNLHPKAASNQSESSPCQIAITLQGSSAVPLLPRQVCEAQLQFAPRAALPVFGGTRGAEVEKSIGDIQASFQMQLTALRGLNYNILDVKATRHVAQ
jgi:hypothetical protein